MTVRDLLSVYENHSWVDVHIIEHQYDCFTDSYDEVYVADWLYKDHFDWYCGQLDYFSTRGENELKPYFGRQVKYFEVINTVELDKCPRIYIIIK